MACLMELLSVTQLAMDTNPVLPHALQRTMPGMKLQKDTPKLMITLKSQSQRYELTFDKSLTKK